MNEENAVCDNVNECTGKTFIVKGPHRTKHFENGFREESRV